jgi:uncharacterized protein (TIGR02284 family)
MVTAEETIEHLNGLIAVCKDGEHGYATAAEHVRNSELTTVFADYAKQRARFARELQAEVERLGGVPSDSGTLTAALHRGWIDVKSALSGGDAGGIIAACETGEDSAQAAFERVVNTDISGQSRSLIEKQYRQIEEAHKRMLRLKEEAADGAEFPKNE